MVVDKSLTRLDRRLNPIDTSCSDCCDQRVSKMEFPFTFQSPMPLQTPLSSNTTLCFEDFTCDAACHTADCTNMESRPSKRQKIRNGQTVVCCNDPCAEESLCFQDYCLQDCTDVCHDPCKLTCDQQTNHDHLFNDMISCFDNCTEECTTNCQDECQEECQDDCQDECVSTNCNDGCDPKECHVDCNIDCPSLCAPTDCTDSCSDPSTACVQDCYSWIHQDCFNDCFDCVSTPEILDINSIYSSNTDSLDIGSSSGCNVDRHHNIQPCQTRSQLHSHVHNHSHTNSHSQPLTPSSSISTPLDNHTCRVIGCNVGSFVSEDALQDHIEEHHLQKINGRYICQWEGCVKKHTKKSAAHICHEAHARSCGKTYCAPTEPFSDTHLHKLKRHYYVHSGKKAFTCDFPGCGSSHATRAQLKVHQARHNPKQFGCEECDRVFTTQNQLRTHVNAVHKREKHFKCPDCGYACDDSSNMSSHRRKQHTFGIPCPCSNYTLHRPPSHIHHLISSELVLCAYKDGRQAEMEKHMKASHHSVWMFDNEGSFEMYWKGEKKKVEETRQQSEREKEKEKEKEIESSALTAPLQFPIITTNDVMGYIDPSHVLNTHAGVSNVLGIWNGIDKRQDQNDGMVLDMNVGLDMGIVDANTLFNNGLSFNYPFTTS